MRVTTFHPHVDHVALVVSCAALTAMDQVNSSSRREFVISCTSAITYLVGNGLTRRRARPLRLGLLTAATLDPSVVDDVKTGVMLGIAEAGRLSDILGGAVELVTRDTSPDELESTVGAMQVAAVLGALPAGQCLTVAETARVHGLLFINLVATEDELREAHCGRSMFHVAASTRMEQRAREDAHGSTESPVALWLPSLERYGAAQLNDRYRHAAGRPMSSAAWAGWFGVKAIVESVERAQSSDGEALVAYLERPAAGFDGHKGELLSFRSSDHQLRQPLFCLKGSTTMVEVPSDSALAENAEEAMDRLAGGPEPSTCRWQPS